MDKKYKLILLRDDQSYNGKAAKWFNNVWGVSENTYLESITECQRTKNKVPQWYIITDSENDGKIIAGMGVIENDFHERRDLSPNVCAVFTDPDYRRQGLAKYLLDFVCEDMAKFGYDILYLITSHTEFYERCGWEFFCHVKEIQGKTVRMYKHTRKS